MFASKNADKGGQIVSIVHSPGGSFSLKWKMQLGSFRVDTVFVPRTTSAENIFSAAVAPTHAESTSLSLMPWTIPGSR